MAVPFLLFGANLNGECLENQRNHSTWPTRGHKQAFQQTNKNLQKLHVHVAYAKHGKIWVSQSAQFFCYLLIVYHMKSSVSYCKNKPTVKIIIKINVFLCCNLFSHCKENHLKAGVSSISPSSSSVISVSLLFSSSFSR